MQVINQFKVQEPFQLYLILTYSPKHSKHSLWKQREMKVNAVSQRASS